MITRPLRTGRLILAPRTPGRIVSASPLQDGPDISWLHHCRPGDDQGRDGACAIFAFANWFEIMFGRAISNADCLALYSATLASLGLSEADGGGLTFEVAFNAAHASGWLPGCRGLDRVYDLSRLAQQPLLAGYEVTPAWDDVNFQGCLDHAATGPSRGYHAVAIVGAGTLVPNPSKPLVYIENSWGLTWGWNGLAVMTAALHSTLCNELWAVRL